MESGGGQEQMAVHMGSLDSATPVVFHDYFPLCHALVGFFGIGDVKIDFEVFIGDAGYQNGG